VSCTFDPRDACFSRNPPRSTAPDSAALRSPLAAEHSPQPPASFRSQVRLCRETPAAAPSPPLPCASRAGSASLSLVAGERRTIRERAASDALDVSPPHVHATPQASQECPSTSCTRPCCSSHAWGRSRLRNNDGQFADWCRLRVFFSMRVRNVCPQPQYGLEHRCGSTFLDEHSQVHVKIDRMRAASAQRSTQWIAATVQGPEAYI